MAALRYFSQKLLQKNVNTLFIVHNRLATTFQYDNSRDPAPLFFNKEMQQLLLKLTRPDLSKVYKKKKLGTKRLDLPVYKFMTDDELNAAKREAEENVKVLLQMPPVLKPREPITTILSKDPALQGLETTNIVFTDITFGIKNKDRLIVVREPDGTLRKADWELRDRMNQVYFPMKGRELRVPKMFEADNLKSLLKREEYEFILDRTCVQFEPDDPEYHRITQEVYQYINEHNGFETLRSTRHFGPLCFYLAWFKMIDNLLIEILETGNIEEACSLIQVFGNIHKIQVTGENDVLVENYIKEHSSKQGPLELALQAYREFEKERNELQEGLKAAHGH